MTPMDPTTATPSVVCLTMNPSVDLATDTPRDDAPDEPALMPLVAGPPEDDLGVVAVDERVLDGPHAPAVARAFVRLAEQHGGGALHLFLSLYN